MSLFEVFVIVIVLVLLGIILYYVNRMEKMDNKLKWIINVFLVVVVVIGLLNYLGFWQHIKNFRF